MISNNKMQELKDIKKNPGFEIPENYFTDFSANIMSKIEQNEKQERKIIRFVKPVLSLAAALVGFTLISYAVLNAFDSDNNIEVNSTEYSYIENNLSEFSNDILIETIYEEVDTSECVLSEQEIIDYLEEETIEYELLAEL